MREGRRERGETNGKRELEDRERERERVRERGRVE